MQHSKIGGLTTRQREVLQLIARGQTNKEIAFHLRVSIKTVEFHRSRLTERLGFHGIAELTLLAVREGLVDAKSSQVAAA
jgi:DNA-binding NarL/FixJ family response regulator